MSSIPAGHWRNPCVDDGLCDLVGCGAPAATELVIEWLASGEYWCTLWCCTNHTSWGLHYADYRQTVQPSSILVDLAVP